jgi:hypothetical protein
VACTAPLRILTFLLVCGWGASAFAVLPTETLLPATTKGYISTHDVNEVRTKFNDSQLGAWVNDPVMAPFVEDMKKQIGAKLEKAGKKLGVKWEDLETVYAGEVALGLIQPDPKDKMSHATALIVDVHGKKDEVAVLLAKVDANQKADKAVRSVVKAGGIDMVVYTQPLAQGEKVPHRSYHFIKDEQLVLVDHSAVAAGIAARFAPGAKDNLASIEAFQYVMKRNQEAVGDGHHHVRWFVEPFGYAEASRAAQGGRKKRGTDMLKVLQGQGFPAIQGLGGYVFFSTDDEEVMHRTFVYAPAVKRPAGSKKTDKYDLAMRMLNFPNGKNLVAQEWALPDVAAYLTCNMKMQEGFKYSETLVDAIAGDTGVFKEIWESMKVDPNGPQIDIYAGLINHLGERATFLSDVKLPVGLKSERIMALIEVTRPDIVEKTLEKAFAKDPAAKKRLFRGKVIWELTQEEAVAEESGLTIEGAGFVSTTDEEEEVEEEKPVLPNMALTVYEGHLVVSTHVDFIEDLIANEGSGKSLGDSDDYKRVMVALTRLGAGVDSFRYFVRTDESYRGTFELMKQNKLPEAETLLSRILNGILAPEENDAVRPPEFDGSKLPEFDKVSKYMGPGGVYVQSEDNGWWVVGCVLKK